MPAPIAASLHTWIWLAGLSLITTLLARFAPPGALWSGPAFLFLSGWKARHLLNGYLGLSASRYWSRVFNLAVDLFLLAALGLYLLPALI